MALYHLTDSTIEPIHTTSFADVGVLERSHLQRVLREQLDVIAPQCLLLAEEFGDWDNSWRRIDLLAIDKQARLVVIELKRTEDAGHAELQAIRYSAMVSTMSFDQAVEAHRRYLQQRGIQEDARNRILSFLEWPDVMLDKWAPDVRILLVAADFSKELTTTVLWLRDFDIDITCVRVRPHTFEGKTLVNVEVLIPLPETAEYQVKVRARDEARREAAISGDRYQKYDVTAGTTVERQLNKRQAIHRVVRALAERGISPERMSDAVPSFNKYLFASAPGQLNETEFVEAARSECERDHRAFDPRRYSSRGDELIYFGNRTYAVTNQVGTNTEEILEQLTRAFSLPEVTWQRSADRRVDDMPSGAVPLIEF